MPTRYVHLDALLGEDLLGRLVDDLGLGLQFGQEADQRDHDLRLDLDAFLLHVAGGLEDGPGLHLGDLGIDDAQPAAAEAEHRVELVQRLDALGDDLSLETPSSLATSAWPLSSCGRNSCSGGSSVRIVTGRPFMARNMPSKSLPLERQQLGQRLLAVLRRLGQDHLAHLLDVVEEHVLGAAQADALGAEGDRLRRLVGLVGIGADARACGRSSAQLISSANC